MATTSTTQTLIKQIDENAFVWSKASSSLVGTHGAFLTAVKKTVGENDTIKLEDLKYIVLEFGIESGISEPGISEPITIQNVKLNFDERTSTNEKVNSKTAMTKIGPMPSSIYFRVLSFADNLKEYKSGQMPVSINILTF